MAAPPLPIKVVDMPPPASPPPFYIQAKPKKSCRWTTLAFVVLLVWLSASALIVLHLGPECLFKKFSKSSDDDVLKTDALKQRSDDASENSVVDSLDKLLSSAKLRQVVVLTTDDDSKEKTEKPNVVDSDVEEKTQSPLRVVDASTDSVRQGNLGSLQGVFVPAEHIFERPVSPFGASRPHWFWPQSYEQELPRFMQAPNPYYYAQSQNPYYYVQGQNPFYHPFYRAQAQQFYYPQQQAFQQAFQNGLQSGIQDGLQSGFQSGFQNSFEQQPARFQQGFQQAFQPQQQQQQQTFQQQPQQSQQQIFEQPQMSQEQPQATFQHPRPILAVDPNPLQWPQSTETTEAPVKPDSNEVFRRVEQEGAKGQQVISPALGADIRDEIYRQLQRQSQLLSGSQERPAPTWPQATSTEKPSSEVDIDEIYRKLQEESQKLQQEKEKPEAEEEEKPESEEEHTSEDVVEDSFPRIEKMNLPETSTEEPKATTEDASFFKFFEEQAAKMREMLDKTETTTTIDGDTKEAEAKEPTTEAPMEEPKPALIFQEGSEAPQDSTKETKETEVAWTKDQEPIQGDTEDKSMVRAERTN